MHNNIGFKLFVLLLMCGFVWLNAYLIVGPLERLIFHRTFPAVINFLISIPMFFCEFLLFEIVMGNRKD